MKRVGRSGALGAVVMLFAGVLAVQPPATVMAGAAPAVQGPDCNKVWVGPATGSAQWRDVSNWSPAFFAPGFDDTACFGASFGGTAVDHLLLTSPSGVGLTGIAIDETSSIVIDFDLQAGPSDIGGLFLAEGRTLQVDGRISAGRQAGTLPSAVPSPSRNFAQIVGNSTLTIEEGGTLLANTLILVNNVVNDGSILATEGSLNLEGAYSGNGSIDLPAMNVQNNGDFRPGSNGSLTADVVSVFSFARFDGSATIGHLEAGAEVHVATAVDVDTVRIIGYLGLDTPTASLGGVEEIDVGSAESRLENVADVDVPRLVIEPAGRLHKRGPARLRVTESTTLGMGIELLEGDLDLEGAVSLTTAFPDTPNTPYIDLAPQLQPPNPVLRQGGFGRHAGRVDRRPTAAPPSGQNLVVNGCLSIINDSASPRPIDTQLDLVRYDADLSHVDVDLGLAEVEPIAGAHWTLADIVADQATLITLDRVAGDAGEPCSASTEGVAVTADPVTIEEGADASFVDFMVDNRTGAAVTVEALLTPNGSQPLESDDLTVGQTSFTFPAGQTQQTIRLEATSDNTFEGTETGEVTFGGGVTGAIPVSINDHSPTPTVAALAPVIVQEGDPAVFSPVYSNPSEVPIPYPVVVTPVTGDDDDLVPLATTVAFGAPLVLTTIENDVPEGDETFTVTVGGVPATLTIVEDDQFGPGITLVTREHPFVEGGNATFLLKFPTPTPKGISFDWRVSVDPDDLPAGAQPVSAVEDLDLPAIRRVDIPAGAIKVPIDVPIIVDSTPESEESFALVVDLDGMVLPLKSVTSIVDPDLPTVGVTINDPEVTESDDGPAGTIEVVFSLQDFVPGTVVSVPFDVVGSGDLPATPGSDVTPPTGTVVIDTADPQDAAHPGDVTLVFAAPDDDLFEDTETYRVEIGSALEGAVARAGAASAEGRILDDEAVPTVAVLFAGDEVSEGPPPRDGDPGGVLPVLVFINEGNPQRRVSVAVQFEGFDDPGVANALTPANDLTQQSLVVTIDPDSPQDPAAPLFLRVDVPIVNDDVHEGDEKVRARVISATGAVPDPDINFNTAVAVVIDDDAAPDLVAALPDHEITEGGSTDIRLVNLSGVAVERPIVLTYTVSGTNDDHIDPASDILLDGLPVTGPVVQGTATIQPGTDEIDVLLTAIDDSLVEPDEHYDVRITGVTVGVIPESVTSSATADTGVIHDNDTPPGDEADEVAALRDGFQNVRGFFDDWAALFDFDPATWAGRPGAGPDDPAALPAVTDQLASLVGTSAAAEQAVDQLPAPAAADDSLDDVVQAMSDPNDNGTPNEPGEGACDIVFVRNGIRGLPVAPSGEVIRISCQRTLADLARAIGTPVDEWNDSTADVLRGLASALGLDADGELTPDLTIRIVFGVDTDGFYLLGTTGLTLDIVGSFDVSGNATALSHTSSPITGTGTADLHLRLRPGASDLTKLRAGELGSAPAQLLTPIVTGTATAGLGFTTPTATFQWTGTWSVATANGAITTTTGLQQLSADVALTGLSGPSGPATVGIDATLDPSITPAVWNLAGEIDGNGALKLAAFELVDGDFAMTIEGSEITSGSAGLTAVVRPGGNDAEPIDVALTLQFNDDSWSAHGELDSDEIDLSPLLWLGEVHVEVDLAHAPGGDGDVVSGGATITAGTAVVFPEAGSATTPPAGLLTLDDVTATVTGNGSTSLDAASVHGDIADGAIVFDADDVSLNLGPDFADQPLLSIASVQATFAQIADTEVDVAGLVVLQDGRVGADSASISNDVGLFDAVGLGNILPFDVTSVQLAFTQTVPGTELKSLDSFDAVVTGGFDQDALADLHFDLQVQLGGKVVTKSSPAADNVFTFSVAVESFSDGIIRPISLGPIGLGVEHLTVSGDIEVSMIGSIDGWVNGELQPGVSGSITISDGFDDVESANGSSLQVALGGGIDDGGVVLDGTFTFSARRGAFVLDDLQLFTSLHLELDADGSLVPTIEMKSLSIGKLSIPLGTLAAAEVGGMELNFNPAPGQAVVAIKGTEEPNAGARLRFDESIPFLDDWGGAFGGVAVCPDGSVHLLPTSFFSVSVPDGEQLGIPTEIPLSEIEVGIGFDVATSDADAPCSGPALGDSLQDIRLLLSAGVHATDDWPIEFSFEGLEVSLARLVGLQPGFPIVNLDSVSFGVAPTTIAPGVVIGGLLGLGSVDVDGTSVLYLRVLGEVTVNGLGVGAEVILTQYGPVLISVTAPLGIPLGPTGLVLAGVTGGATFGTVIPQPAEPEDLLDLDLGPSTVDTSEEAIAAAVAPAVATGTPTWTRAFSLTLAGHIVHVAAPGMAGGEVIVGMNVGFQPGDGVKLFGRGDLTAFGIPVATGGILYDFTNLIEPRLDVAFAMPGPAAGALGFLSPAEARFVMRIDTKGVAPAIALALRTFVQRVIDGTVELGAATFAQALDAIATRLQANHASPLARLILDTNGNGIVSTGENAVVITSSVLKSRLLALLPTSVSGASAFVLQKNGLVDALFRELFTALDSVAHGGVSGARADLLELFGSANKTLAALAQVLSDALADSVATAMTVFDPSVRIEGSLQPLILGIPFGEPDGEVSLEINRDGVSVGFGASLSKIADHLANLVLPFGIGGALRNVFSLGITDSFSLEAQLGVGGFVPSLVTGTTLLEIDPEDQRWAITGTGAIGFLGFETSEAQVVVVGANNQRFLDDHVQVLFDGSGNVLDLSSVTLDPNKIPITSKADFDNVVKYGGILISNRLMMPGMLTDPATLIKQIGPPPEKFEDLLVWARQLAETVATPASPIHATLYIPSPLAVLDFDYTAGGDDRFDVIAGLTGPDAQAFLDAPFYEGVFDGTLLSLPFGKAAVRADANGLRIEGRLPFLGIKATVELGTSDIVVGGVTVPIPSATAEATLKSADIVALATNLGIPPALIFDPGATATARFVSPAFDLESSDPLEIRGGFRLSAHQNFAGLVEDAQAEVTILAPSPGNLLPDWKIAASVAKIGPIAGATITDASVSFDKVGSKIAGELHGSVDVLGVTGRIDGQLNPDFTGTLDITVANNKQASIGGLGLDGRLTLKLEHDSKGKLVGSVGFLGSAVPPTWLSTASGSASITAAGCIDSNGRSEFILAVNGLGFGPIESNGLRTVTIGARAAQTLPAPTAACALPAGAPTRPSGAAVVRLRTNNGVAQVFVDGQATFNRPGVSVPLLGVTGFFSSTGTGSLTVDGTLPLLSSTLTVGGTLALNSAGPSASLTLATPVGQPLRLGGWAIGGTPGLSVSRLAATVTLTNGTVTVPGAGTIGVSGSLSTRGVGDLTVTMPANGLRLGPAPSPFFATGAFKVGFNGSVGSFEAANASFVIRTGTTAATDIVGIGVALFRIETDGSLDFDTKAFTFEGPDGVGGFSLTVPPAHVESKLAMAQLVVSIGTGTLAIPGIADGTTGHPKLTTPEFSLDTTLDFTRTLAAGTLSLGVASITGKVVLHGSDGVFSLRIEGIGLFQPARLTMGALGSIVLDDFVIASNGTFNVGSHIDQLGPNALSIRDASFTMAKTGTALSTFSASINGGKLFLPMGDPIALPNLSFSASAFFNTPHHIDGFSLGPFLTMTDIDFHIRELASGVLQFKLDNDPTATAFAGSGVLSITSLTVESDGTFDGTINGQLALFGKKLGSATLDISNSNGVVKLSLPEAKAVNINLGFATFKVFGQAFSDGRFSFTGSIGIDLDIIIARMTGSVAVTVGNTGVSGGFAGTACVFPFPCVSASGSMSPTGYVDSRVVVDTNGNGRPDTGFDVDFQIGAAPDEDNVAPSIASHSNVTVNADIPAGRSTTRVHYTTPTATDASGIVPVVCTPPSGSDFPVGATTVTCTATDRSGNTRTRTFTVTVNDTSEGGGGVLSQVVAGGVVSGSGGGFAGGSIVGFELHSDTVVLGQGVAAADGTVTITGVIPADTPPGEHTLVLVGEGPDGEQVLFEQPIVVVEATPSVPDLDAVLPATGTDSLPLVELALALLAAGVVLDVTARCRRRRLRADAGE